MSNNGTGPSNLKRFAGMSKLFTNFLWELFFKSLNFTVYFLLQSWICSLELLAQQKVQFLDSKVFLFSTLVIYYLKQDQKTKHSGTYDFSLIEISLDLLSRK